MIDEVDERREPEGVRQEDELLTSLIAYLARCGEEHDAGEPLLIGEAHLLGECMQMPDERLGDLTQSRIRGCLESSNHDLGEVVLGHWFRHWVLPHLALSVCP